MSWKTVIRVSVYGYNQYSAADSEYNLFFYGFFEIFCKKSNHCCFEGKNHLCLAEKFLCIIVDAAGKRIPEFIQKEGKKMDKQTFVLEIVKHYICNRITELKTSEEEVFDDKFCASLHHIACKTCKVYDRITTHVRVHEKSPDGECHMHCPAK